MHDMRSTHLGKNFDMRIQEQSKERFRKDVVITTKYLFTQTRYLIISYS